jgi:LPS-assembly protein
MRSRLTLVITVAVLCHLFTGAPLVISQAHPEERSPAGSPTTETPQKSDQQQPSQTQEFGKIQISATEGEPLSIKAKEQEKRGDVFTLRGDVEVRYRGYVLKADTISYNSVTGDLTAEGNISFDGGPHDMHITASHGGYNIHSQTGKFYDVAGTTGARFRGRNVTLTSTNPVVFSGKVVEKRGQDEYVIYHGTVTSCELPHPKWTFSAGKIVLVVGSKARIHNTVFHIKGVPVIYLPYAAPPVERLGRESGFLLPTFGTSSSKGTILGDSFYWAINRSMDATLGGEYLSRRGWLLHEIYRARPGASSYVNFDYFGVIDRLNQGGEDIKLNGETRLPGDFRAVASLNYLSSFVFRLAFSENFSQAVNSEVKSVAFVSKTVQGLSFNAFASRYQNFESTTSGDLVTIFHAPGFEISSVDKRLGSTPFYWGFDTALEGLRRTEPGFDTPNLVGRFDVRPDVSLPVFTHGWTFRPELALRDTFYTESRIPNGGVGLAVQETLNRRSLQFQGEVRPPTLGKVFDKTIAGRKIKHTIEPRLVYRYVNGINNFPSIIRFDDRDILSDTNEIEYGLTQRLYLKRTKQNCAPQEKPAAAPPIAAPNPGMVPKPGPLTTPETGVSKTSDCTPAGANEFVTWEVKQKYFFDPNFGGAVVNGARNVLTTTVDFAAIAFLADPRRFAPIVSRLRFRTSNNSDVQWELDYDTKKGRINSSTFFTSFRLGDFFFGGSHAYLVVPPEMFVTSPIPGPTQFNQYRALVGYGSPSKRGLSAAVNIGFDSTLSFLQYSAAQAAYNWDCCGISLEYRRFALGSVRNENAYRFAFTLANIGTFGNLRRQERLF